MSAQALLSSLSPTGAINALQKWLAAHTRKWVPDRVNVSIIQKKAKQEIITENV